MDAAGERSPVTASHRFSRRYGFVRCRQLEGTFPGRPETGVWIATILRLRRGWGRVLEEDWPSDDGTSQWPPAEPPGLDAKAKGSRTLCYQRIHDSLECKQAIAFAGPVYASFEITDQWFDAKDGIVSMPGERPQIVGTHGVLLTGYSDEEGVFRFINSWGPNWGKDGFGQLPYEFFDRWMIESYLERPFGELPRNNSTTVVELSWASPDFAERIFHARELYDAAIDERLGWAFAVQLEDRLEVEELYVRPQFRRRGYADRLMRMLSELSVKAGLPLQFVVPFPDCQPGNLAVVQRFFAAGGYKLTDTEERSAPYAAVMLPSVVIPPPPSLRRPHTGAATTAPGIPALAELIAIDPDEGDREPPPSPVSEANGLLNAPDWKSRSDETFVSAARAVFNAACGRAEAACMIRYLTRDEVLDIHRWALEAFGGKDGFLNEGMLDSAISQPSGSFAGEEFYATVSEKAATLGFALVRNHPFLDGNKRTGFWSMATFLLLNGYELTCNADEAERAVLAVASSEWSRDQLLAWLRSHSSPTASSGPDSSGTSST